VLSYQPGTLLALAVFAGATFLATGLTQRLTSAASTAGAGCTWSGGILSITAAILTLAWPEGTLVVVSLLLAWFLVAFAARGGP
jgi:uncharacterized membrane protein HdeD (DUF308 family)